LGLTNIDQNNIFRILTVVSVIGIPRPSSQACGNELQDIQNTDWAYGYIFALFIIAVSALVPNSYGSMARLW